MVSAYPGALDTFTSKTDDVNDVEASHINDLQNSVVAIQTELGLDPAGSDTDVATRFSNLSVTGEALVFAKWDDVGGTPTLGDKKNVSSITDNGTGNMTFNFTTNLATNTYAVVTGLHGGTVKFIYHATRAVGSVVVITQNIAPTTVDANGAIAIFGDLS